MKYFICRAGHQELYYSGCLKKNPVSFGPVTTSVAAGPVEITAKEWQTSSFHAVLMQWRASESLPVIAEMPDEIILLCFMGKGKNKYQCRHIRTTSMDANTNNFFYLPDVRVIYQLEKDEPCECFKIGLSRDYIGTLACLFPGTFVPLSKKMGQRRSFELGTTHFFTTPEMNRIIEQIKNCEQMGPFAQFYFESKVRELLVLQWQYAVAQKNSADRSFWRYRDQINKARNIIEHTYQDPPGIHKLSQQVGMCETLLKAGFKSVFGTTVFHYLFNYRMDLARSFLKDRSLNISGISELLGYKNLSHFTKAFKRKFDMSPLEYRKRTMLGYNEKGRLVKP